MDNFTRNETKDLPLDEAFPFDDDDEGDVFPFEIETDLEVFPFEDNDEGEPELGIAGEGQTVEQPQPIPADIPVRTARRRKRMPASLPVAILNDPDMPVETRRKAAMWLARNPTMSEIGAMALALWDADPQRVVQRWAATGLAELSKTYPSLVTETINILHKERSVIVMPPEARLLLIQIGNPLPEEDPFEILPIIRKDDIPAQRKPIIPPERLLKIGQGLVVTAVVVVLAILFGKNQFLVAPESTAAIPTESMPVEQAETLDLAPLMAAEPDGVERQADILTDTVDQDGMSSYTVENGDDLLSIAQETGLDPITLLYSNLEDLGDDPHHVQPGVRLDIPPSNGVYYRWNRGDTIDQVAALFRSPPDALTRLDGSPLNDGDLVEGSWIQVVGGYREPAHLQLPFISSENPSVGMVLGDGSCAAPLPVNEGTGDLAWPAKEQQTASYTFSPSMNHYGVDLAGESGEPVVAADSGVVVYAGPSHKWGNLVLIDHGYGWQTAYARLGTILVGCGEVVEAGQTVGEMAESESPFVHFEVTDLDGNPIDPMILLP